MARSALAWAVACAYAQLLVHLAAAQGSSTDPGAPPPMPAPRPSPPLVVDLAPKDGQPWWMLLILVACALLIILLMVAATFSMSWCFNVIRERTTSNSYLERSEPSQLSVTASAWATAAAAMRARHQAQQSAAPQRKGVSMDMLETLPKFQFKDVAAQHPVASLARVVVELRPCSRRDDAAATDVEADAAAAPITKAELAAATCAASEAREGCQNTTLGQRQEQQRCQQQQQCQETQQRQEQRLPGTAKPLEGCSPDNDVERGSCEATSQLGRSGSDDTCSGSSGQEGPTSPSSTVGEQGQGTAAHAAPGRGGSLRLGADQCCAICLEPYSPECVLRQLPCGHCFHTRCVDEWLLQNGSCPSCRSPLMQGDGSGCCKP